jgi:hypothetical protein
VVRQGVACFSLSCSADAVSVLAHQRDYYYYFVHRGLMVVPPECLSVVLRLHAQLLALTHCRVLLPYMSADTAMRAAGFRCAG